MVHPHEGGGGSVGAQVSALSAEIEGLIGQLRGVEESWRQMTAPLEAWEDDAAANPGAPGPQLNSRNFQVRGDYGFEVGHLVPGGRSTADGSTDEAGDQIQSAMDAAFETYRGSGAGALDFSRYILTQVIDPDHAALASSAHALDDVAMWLYDFTDDAVPEFVSSLRASWPATSLGSASFYRFYEDLADVCTHYYGGAAQLAAVTAATSTIVRLYQENLVDVLRAGRDQLVKALESWQSFKGPEQLVAIERGDSDGRAALLGGLSLATGILGLIPGLGLAAGGVSVVAGILSYNVGDKDVETYVDKVSTALEITTNLNEGLLALRREMGDALDAIGQGGSGRPSLDRYVSDSLGNPNWKAREVNLG